MEIVIINIDKAAWDVATMYAPGFTRIIREQWYDREGVSVIIPADVKNVVIDVNREFIRFQSIDWSVAFRTSEFRKAIIQ